MIVPLYLPYYEQPHWDIPFPIIGEITIHAFGVLVAFALVFGTWVSRWHGQKVGQSPTNIVDCITWTCITGFVVAHIVSVVFYFPERLAEDPLQLFYVWNGLSSFGGFLGGLIGCVVFLRRHGLPILPYVDTVTVGLAGGWVFGRMGCSVAHDHPGLSTDFFLAFDHPTRGPIHDLGFYEFLFTIFLFSVVLIIRRYKWPPGAIPGLVCILYAPVRFFLDFLRVQDAKYLYLTPGQWFAVVLLVGGVVLMRYSFTKSKERYAGIYERGRIDEDAKKGRFRPGASSDKPKGEEPEGEEPEEGDSDQETPTRSSEGDQPRRPGKRNKPKNRS